MCRECSFYREDSWNIPSDFTPTVSRECSVYIPDRASEVPTTFHTFTPDASNRNTLTYETEQNNNYASTPIGLAPNNNSECFDNNHSLAFVREKHVSGESKASCMQTTFNTPEPIYHECNDVRRFSNKLLPIWEETYGEIWVEQFKLKSYFLILVFNFMQESSQYLAAKHGN